MLKFSLSRRWASVAIVSNTMDDLPEPETPVKMVILRLGMRRETFFRLFSRAPRSSMYSWGIFSPFYFLCNIFIHVQNDLPHSLHLGFERIIEFIHEGIYFLCVADWRGYFFMPVLPRAQVYSYLPCIGPRVSGKVSCSLQPVSHKAR